MSKVMNFTGDDIASCTQIARRMDATQTPFFKSDDGKINIFLVEGAVLDWGHRFDKEIGYRVYIKYVHSDTINAFTIDQARKLAKKISLGERNEEILSIGIALKQMANQCEKLNRAWIARGAPPMALDQIGHPGNA